ncbi:hypothetical protein [Puia sp.]|jgi:MFS family permease|uniref:hypothetical protein n=1 Tax=Puia sp. TaxID=2045100 RepID=UPI002F420ED7
MRKFGIYLLFVAVAIVIASLYGVANHQVTFSVSQEYYTRFKFIQTNLADTLAAQHMTQPRSAVVIAGVKTSWLIGLCIGVILGLVALILPTADTFLPSAFQSLGLTILVSLLVAVGAYYAGPNAHIGSGIYATIPAHLPDNLTNRPAFLHAAWIQYGVHLGYIIGLVAGIIFLLIKNTRVRRRISNLDSDPNLDSPASL